MSDEEYLKKKLDIINKNSYYGLMDVEKINRLQKEDNKMKKATSVQNIKNVKDVCFDISNDPIERESKLTIVASTNDDIFAFEFDGEDLLQSCKRAGLFTGWEKDQKIRELEEELSNWKREAADCLRLRDEAKKEKNKLEQQLQQVKRDKKELTDSYERLNSCHKGVLTDYHQLIDKVEKLKEENKQLKEKNFCVTIRINAFKNTNDKLQDENEELKYQLKDIQTTKEVVEQKLNTREDILDQAKKCVCGQREQDYGTPESNFKLIADLWNDYLYPTLGGPKKDAYGIKSEDVAMMMALLKIARIRNGGGSGDSFVDLAGYAACGGEIWHGQKVKDQN